MRGNVTVKADVIANQVNPRDFDAVIIPGGCASDKIDKED